MTAFGSSRALWASVTERARRSGQPIQEAQQWFLRERFLSRVFTQDDETWVLKGGTALIARVQDARWSRDVDLMTQRGDLGAAVRDLQAAAARESEDQLTMSITDTRKALGTHQGQVDGTALHLTVFSGTKQLAGMKIDLVAGTLMTGDPERATLRSRLQLPGLETVPVRLYPVADHMADKVVATESTYGKRPSSRVRDMVDLVILGKTQTVDGAALQRAIAGERLHQHMPERTEFDPPADWARTYDEIASHSSLTRGISMPEAIAYVRQLVEPAMAATRDLTGTTWDPSAGAYLPSDQVESRPQPEPRHGSGDAKPVVVTEHTRGGNFTIGHRRHLPGHRD